MNIFILVKFNNPCNPVTFDTPIQMNNYVLKRSLILNKQEKINPIKAIFKINVGVLTGILWNKTIIKIIPNVD